MKLLLLISLLFSTSIGYTQSPFQKQYDSLTKVTGRQVIGYSKDYRNKTLTITLWSKSFYDYHEEEIWSVITLDSATVKRVYDMVAKKTGKWIVGFTQTYFKSRETFSVRYLEMDGEEKYDIIYTRQY